MSFGRLHFIILRLHTLGRIKHHDHISHERHSFAVAP